MVLRRWGALEAHMEEADESVKVCADSALTPGGKRCRVESQKPAQTRGSAGRNSSSSCSGSSTSSSGRPQLAGFLPAGYEAPRWVELGAERDPAGFAYFLAANLPLPTAQLLRLLEAQDVVDRLR